MSTRVLPLFVMLLAGCSVTGRTARPVPLPPNAEPDDIVSIDPEPIPPLTPEQQAYLDAMDPPERQAAAKAAATKSKAYQTAPPPAAAKLKQDRTAAAAAGKLTEKQYQDARGVYEEQQELRKLGLISEEEFKWRQAQAWAAWKIQEDRADAQADGKPGQHKNILALCGGVAHGAWQVGVLCGWTCCGGRPDFDVVTGVSTGALIAPAAFLGSAYDAEIKHFYTTTETRDVFRFKKIPPFGLGTDSFTTNRPLRRLVESMMLKPGFVEAIAAEHAKGRRLYMGTTNLDTMRFTTWDIGAIASQGTCEAKALIVDIMLGASAMPPLMTPTRITVNIDGCPHEEMHVDGGTTRNLFLYPPSDWPGTQADPNSRLLAGANVYCIVGGKVYGDPIGVKPKVAAEGLRAVSTLLASSQRAELFRMRTYCQAFDMNFHYSAIPADYEIFNASDFDPEKMTKLLEAGYQAACCGKAWDQGDLREDLGEVVARRGVCLTASDVTDRGTFEPGRARAPSARPANAAVNPIPPLKLLRR